MEKILIMIRTALKEKMVAIPTARQMMMDSTPVLDNVLGQFLQACSWESSGKSANMERQIRSISQLLSGKISQAPRVPTVLQGSDAIN